MKDKTEFRKDMRAKNGLGSWCKECVDRCSKEYWKTPAGREVQKRQTKKYRGTIRGKEVVAGINRKARLKTKYGITIEDYDRILQTQGGCAICGTKTPGGRGRFHVDHDHITGKIRGLLCSGCNTKLGWYERNKGGITKYLVGQNIFYNELDLA